MRVTQIIKKIQMTPAKPRTKTKSNEYLLPLKSAKVLTTNNPQQQPIESDD